MPTLRDEGGPPMSSAPRHVYVHVPFCARRCSYCDFSIAVRRTVPVDDYVTALGAELRLRVGPSVTPVDSIYLGGGTPSRLGGHGVAETLRLLRRYFELAQGAEVTIEANPDDVSLRAVADWAEAGVNRVSLGAQTFDDRALAWMHRTHDAARVEDAVCILQTGGIASLSLDLIFALPRELGRNLDSDISRLLALDPAHVSVYGLTVEPATPLGKWVASGSSVELPEEGYEADYLTAHERLTAAGLEHYEVSNYARPGSRARHNSAYWRGVPYWGFGPSAHEFNGSTRRWNARHYADWRHRLRANTDPIGGFEALTPDNVLAESVYLGLRSIDGLREEKGDASAVDAWMEAGWMTRTSEGRLRCTAIGWLRLDSLAAALTHHRSR